MLGLLYGWTKEYIFGNLSWAQILMYYTYGMELKYGKPQKAAGKNLKDMSQEEIDSHYEELKAEKERLRKQYGKID